MKTTLVVASISALFSLNALADMPYVFSKDSNAVADEVNENFTHLLNLNSQVSASITTTNAELIEISKEVDEVVDLVSKFESDATDLIDTTAELEVDVKSVEDNLSALSVEVNEANTTALRAETSVSEAGVSISLLQALTVGLQESLETEAAEIQALSASLALTDETATSVQAAVDEAKVSISEGSVLTSDNTASIAVINSALEVVNDEIKSIEAGAVCATDGLTNDGAQTWSFLYEPTGFGAGDTVEFNGTNMTIYSIPYWGDVDESSYILTVPMGSLSVYTNSTLDNPCYNTFIDEIPTYLTLATEVGYSLVDGNLVAIIETNINVKIKDTYNVFDISYSLSDTVDLGSDPDNSSYDMEEAIKDVRQSNEDSLLGLLHNITITSTDS